MVVKNISKSLAGENNIPSTILLNENQFHLLSLRMKSVLFVFFQNVPVIQLVKRVILQIPVWFSFWMNNTFLINLKQKASTHLWELEMAVTGDPTSTLANYTYKYY